MQKTRLISGFTAVLLSAALMTSCGGSSTPTTGGSAPASNIPANTVNSIDDLTGKKIGVQLGTTGDIFASDIEGATVERYNKGADAVLALKQGKVDAVRIAEQPAKVFVSQNDDLRILEEDFAEEEYAICIKKGNDELTGKINAALAELKADGTLDSIRSNWIGEEAGQHPYTSPEGTTAENGTLVMATNAEFPPYESMDGDKVVGFDADMMTAVCDKLGMDLVIENMEFDSIIAAVDSGKADVGAAGMTITEDRLENVNFSDPYTTSTQVIITRAK